MLTQNKNCGKLINVAATGKREPTEQRQKRLKKLLTQTSDCDKISTVVKNNTEHFEKHQKRK